MILPRDCRIFPNPPTLNNTTKKANMTFSSKMVLVVGDDVYLLWRLPHVHGGLSTMVIAFQHASANG
jgi:hypothetical protein